MENFKKKTEKLVKVENFYSVLAPIIHELAKDRKICFDTLGTVPTSNAWVPADEKFEYDPLLKFMEDDHDFVAQLSEKIASDYRKVIKKFIEKNGTGKLNPLLEGGKKWTLKVFRKWGSVLVENSKVDFDANELIKIEKELRAKIKEKGEEFFGYAEGNVIGDHVFIEKSESKDKEQRRVYLAGMRIVPRIGKGYYDFIRALDWIFLKTPSSQRQFDQIVKYMRSYSEKQDINWEEMKLVATTRFIGIGWDMFGRGDFGGGDTEEKKKYLLKFIKREY